MKPNILNRFLIKQLLAAACITSAACAATATKSATGIDLTQTASWSGGSGLGFPTSADVATWDTSSLGAGLTADSDVNWGSIAITGALENIDIIGFGLITTGNITLAGSQTLSIANDMELSGGSIYNIADVTGTTATDLTISGIISSADFGLTKTGTGTLTLSGFNNYTGATTINSGVLAISNAGALGLGGVAIDGGTLRINNSAFTSAIATLGNTISVASGKTGLIDLIGSGVNANPLTLNPGNITVDGTLKITRSSGNYGTTNCGAQFSGSGALEIGDTNSGVAPANGSNTQGRFWMKNADVFTNFTGSVHILTNGNLTLFGPSAAANSGQLVNGNDVTIDTGGYLSLLGFSTGGGISTIGNLNGGGTITRNSGTSLAAILRVAGGDFTGSFNTAVLAGNTSINLEKIGTGTLTLSGANTAPGTTTIKNGAIVVSGGNDRLRTAGSVTLGDTSTSGTLVLGDSTAASNQTLAGLATMGSGGSVVGGHATTDSLLTLNIASASTFGGTLGGAGTNENKLALTKGGTAALTLSGSSTYAGATTVNAGTLLVNNATGSATGTGTVTVKSTATFGGTGAVTGAVILESGGTLAPGVLIESLATGPLTLSAGATLATQINSSGTPAADVIDVTGNVNLGGTLTVTDIAGVPAVITLGTKLTLITYNTGTLTGIFIGKPEASTFAVGGNTFKIRYADGNAVTLEAVAAGYSGWASTNALSQTAAQDRDNDGVSNGAEWVLGGSATTNDAVKLPTVSTTPGGDLVFSFVRKQTSKTADTAVSIQVGTTLATWPSTYSVGNTTATSTAGVTVTDNLNGTDTVTLTVAQTPDAKKFARLNVVITP